MFSYEYEYKPSDFDLFVGMDVSKKSNSVTFASRDEILRSVTMPYGSEAILRYVEKHFPGQVKAFVYEAGPTGYGMSDELREAGHYCMVAVPSMILKAPGQRVKTNRLDSRQLVEQLRAGQLKAVHVPRGSYRFLRHLAQLRKRLVARRMACKQQIKSLLLLEQIRFPVKEGVRSNWSKWTLEQLGCLECGTVIRFKLDRYLSQVDFFTREVLKTEKETKRFCRQDPELKRCVELLMSLPGIGVTIAIYLLSRIGDWRLLRNSRQLPAFFGLIPSEHSTGEKVNRGPITRMGDRLGRSLLIEAAWVAIRKDNELMQCYLRIFNANNRDKDASKQAIVAVARKLTTRMYAVLKQQRPYRLS